MPKKIFLVIALTLLVFPAIAGEPVPVTARPLAELAVYPEQRAPAQVTSQNDSRISTEISARINDIPVLVGQVVEQGALLARLDGTDYELALQREQAAAESLAARIALARYQWERAQTLAQQQLISDELFKQREADLNILLAEQKGSQAALEQARHNVEKTAMRAPFRAVVMERLGQVGELAAPGTPLLRIVDAAHIEVSAQVQADQAASLAAAKTIELVNGANRHALQLRTITPAMDARTRTREARLTFTGATALPGTAGELVWRSRAAHIPAELILRRNDKLGFFQVVDGQARFVALPDAQEGRPAATNHKLDALVIVEGRFRLQDGDAVSAR
jgi:RND family efflux transporter MFP subunit